MDFQNSFTYQLASKFVEKWLLKIQSNLKCVATLPCEIFVCVKIKMSERLSETNHQLRCINNFICFVYLLIGSFTFCIKYSL